jgi:hypothetical protein
LLLILTPLELLNLVLNLDNLPLLLTGAVLLDILKVLHLKRRVEYNRSIVDRRLIYKLVILLNFCLSYCKRYN